MAEDVSMRLMRAGEEREVCELVSRVFDEFVASDFPQEGVDEFHRYADADALAQRVGSGELVLVAEEEGRIVGMIELRGFGHIAMLFVESRGKGIGRRLVGEALQICYERGVDPDRVTVNASRFAAPIYERLGFETEGPERTENGITYLPMVFRFDRER